VGIVHRAKGARKQTTKTRSGVPIFCSLFPGFFEFLQREKVSSRYTQLL
jgi:hypothetical protein